MEGESNTEPITCSPSFLTQSFEFSEFGEGFVIVLFFFVLGSFFGSLLKILRS